MHTKGELLWRLSLFLPAPPPSSCHPDRRGRRPRRPASPSCQSTEPLSPFLSSRPSEASGGIWEPTCLYKRFLRSVAAASSVEMTRETLASTDAQRRWLRRSTLASTVPVREWGRWHGQLAARDGRGAIRLGCSWGGGIFALTKMTEGAA